MKTMTKASDFIRMHNARIADEKLNLSIETFHERAGHWDLSLEIVESGPVMDSYGHHMLPGQMMLRFQGDVKARRCPAPTQPDRDRLSGDELEDMLKAACLSDGWFCRITGTNPRTIRRWFAGEQDIPAWVEPFLTAAATPDGSRAIKRGWPE